MPIELRELVIKTSVKENATPHKTAQLGVKELAKLKQELIEACVEKVLTEMKKERER